MEFTYYDCTPDRINNTILNGFKDPDDTITGPLRNTKLPRFVQVQPPTPALFAVYSRRGTNEKKGPVVEYQIQWYGRGNEVVQRFVGSEFLWRNCYDILRKHCLERQLFYYLIQLPTYSSISSLCRSIVENNTLRVPLYPQQVEYMNNIMNKINEIFQYMGLTVDQFKDRVMRGFSSKSGFPLEGITYERNTYITSFYHETLIHALDHLTEKGVQIEDQKNAAYTLRKAWVAFQDMLEKEPKDKPFDDDLLKRIEDVLRHDRLPVEDKDYIILYKKKFPRCFDNIADLYIDPSTAPFRYTLKGLDEGVWSRFLNDFQVTATIEENRAGGGKSHRVSEDEASDLFDQAVRVSSQQEYDIDPDTVNSLSQAFQQNLMLYGTDDADKIDDAISTTEEQLRTLLQQQMEKQGVTDPTQLPKPLIMSIYKATKALQTL